MEPYNTLECMNDKNISILVRRANTLGLRSFVIAASPAAGKYQTVFEKVTPDMAFKLLFAGMAQAIEMDKNKHPEYSATHRAALDAFLKEISECVVRLNNKLK